MPDAMEPWDAYNASALAARYPASRFWTDGRWASAVWKLGNNYRNATRLYGAYPPGFLPRVLAMIPHVSETRILHLFSGSLPPGAYTRLDCNPEREPDVLGRAEDVDVLLAGREFDVVIADPPYTAADAARYGTRPPNKRLVLYALHRLLCPGAWVFWLDTSTPLYRKDMWAERAGVWIQRSVGHRYRGLVCFQRKEGDDA